MAPDPVAEAFAATPREWFLPADQRPLAGEDRALPIAHGQTSSQPTTVMNMLRLLDVRRGQRVLDVGAGSGWTTALLAHLVGADGWVLGLEAIPELAAWGAANLARTARPQAQLAQADPGVLGAPEAAPYDRILVSAAARRMPKVLLDQLADPGRMVVPIDGWMTLVERNDGEDALSRHGSYRFVPLVDA